MTTSARVMCDSVSGSGHRVTTFECTFHRFILAEVNTHKLFSRNSASSRARPMSKTIDAVVNDIAWPVVWPAEKKGMQGGEPLTKQEEDVARSLWIGARNSAVNYANALTELGLHKSLVNRLLEPFMWHTAIITSVDWEGFWDQRVSPLAQPEFRVMAELMQEAMSISEPTELGPHDWHMPYINLDDWDWARTGKNMDYYDYSDPRWALRRISTARCCRVSYLTQNGVRDPSEDMDLFFRLENPGDGPPHASPLEHVATPNWRNEFLWQLVDEDGQSRGKELLVPIMGNLRGYDQLRHRVMEY